MKRTLYKETADRIESYIRDHRMEAGTRLPSARQFARQFNVSSFTVFNALDELKYRGLIESRPQSGFYVSPDGWQSLFPNMPDWGNFLKQGWLQERGTASDFFESFKKNTLNPYRVGEHFGAASLMETALRRVLAKGDLWDNADHDYRGSLKVRKAICLHCRRYGIEASPEEVLITNSAFNAMSLAKGALMRPGTNFICEETFSLRSDTAYTSYGIQRRYMEMDGGGIVLDSLRQLLAKNRRSLVGSMFGTADSRPGDHRSGLMDEKAKRAFLKLCYAAKAPVIEYDVHRDFMPETDRPVKSYDPFNAVIYMGDLTRTFLADFRFGWVVAPVKVVNKMADLHIQSEGTQNTLSQAIACELLGEGGLYYEYLDRLRGGLAENNREALRIARKALEGMATCVLSTYMPAITFIFKPEIDLKKMYQNRGDLDFLPAYFVNPGWDNRIAMGTASLPLPAFEAFLEKLADLARQSRR